MLYGLPIRPPSIYDIVGNDCDRDSIHHIFGPWWLTPQAGRKMEGYAKFASFMGKHPESVQVLRFSDVNLQNILYLQAEIYGLREDLRKIEAQSQNSSSEDVKNFALDWYTLANTQDDDGTANKQWQKVIQLRELLKEYSIDPPLRCLI